MQKPPQSLESILFSDILESNSRKPQKFEEAKASSDLMHWLESIEEELDSVEKIKFTN